MNYYRRYMGDYLSATARLSLLDHGAYTMLLDHYYAEEKPLPLDLQELYTMVRAMTTVDRRAVDKVLARYFERQADGYHNERADHEIEVSRKARDNGGKGGRPRTGNETGDVSGYGTEDETGHETEHETGDVTGNGGGSGHPLAVNHQPPAVEPPTAKPPAAITAAAERRAAKEARAERTRPAREAYSKAYERRWEVPPTWDKQANSCMAAFVEKVGSDDAPGIAAFYVGHNRQDYVRAKHDVTLLVRDARGLRTEWQTGRKVTDTEARQADSMAARGDQAQRLIELSRRTG